ncbi:MAG: SBBP repeat-containing protein [Candidatus Sulfotelmatobacter sp.]
MFAEVRTSYLRALFISALLVVASAFTASSAGQASPSQKTSPAQKSQIVENFGRLPLSFEANHGQADKSVKFLSRGRGYELYLTGDKAVLTLRSPAPGAVRVGLQRKRRPLAKSVEFAPDVVRMRLAGATGKAEPTGEEPLPGTANYFIGNDPARWHTSVPTYAKVRYTGVYPGIDLVYYGNQRQLEYDFVVAPGAEPKSVRLQFSGAKELHLAANGDVVVTTANGALTLRKPLVYQIVDGNRRSIAGDFVLAKHTVGFRLGSYNHAKVLVIDPVLAYSTYLGGSGADAGNAIAVDSAGNVYVAGWTTSANFPVTPGAFQTTNHATANGLNAFVTKLNLNGTALLYSTYLGGSGSGNGGDQASALAVDNSGNAYITGSSYSADFPVTPGVFQATNHAAANGLNNVFVAKLNPTGTALVYSSFLGGSGGVNLSGSPAGDQGSGLALDNSGNAYVTGEAVSTDFPVTPGAFLTTSPGQSAFVTKLNPTGTALVYSTYLGMIGDKYGSGSTTVLAVNASDNAYITGATSSTDFPVTPGVFQTTNKAAANSFNNVFVTELNSTGSGLVYSTYLGGSGTGACCAGDKASAVAVDGSGNVYVAGTTQSTDFPVTPGAFQTTNHGTASKYDVPNAFVTKLNPTGTALVYSTYLGGSGGIVNASPTLGFAGGDQASGLAIDGSGNAYVTGSTASTDFPVTQGAYQTTNNDQPGCVGGCIGGYNAFITELNSAGSALVDSTYLGGNGINPYDTVGLVEFGSGDQSNALALDGSGNIYVTGSASSSDFPVTAGVFQTTIRSPQNAFVAKLNMGGTSTTTTPTVTVTPALTSITSGQVLPVTISVSGASGSPTPTGTVTLASGTYSSAAAALSGGSATIDIPGGALLGEPYPYNALSPDLLAANYVPDAASSSIYNFASGLASVQVLAAVVWVTPSLSSINLAEAQSQPISLAIVVTSGPGYPTPTGAVTLTDGSYTSAAATLSGGNATITVPAGTMTTGFNINLMANYLGDNTYAAVSAPSMVYVNAGTLVVSVVPSATSITSAQALTVTITVSAGSGNPIPNGTVMLFGNGYYSTAGYSSASTALTGGSATITIPAGSLPVGIDSLQAYFDDAATGGVDAIGIVSVTVTNASGPSFTIIGTPVTVTAGATTGNTSTITVTPSGGFTGSVTLTAAVTSSPSNAQNPPTLSFGSTSPVNITGPASGTATLTTTTTAAAGCGQASQVRRAAPWYIGGSAGLACVLFLGVPARRRGRRTALGMLVLLLALAAAFPACGSGGSPTCNGGTGGTTPGTYTITVTGTSGSTAATGTVTLTVQ